MALADKERSANLDCLVGIWKDNEEFEESFSVIETVCTECNITLIQNYEYFDQEQGKLLADVFTSIVDDEMKASVDGSED